MDTQFAYMRLLVLLTIAAMCMWHFFENQDHNVSTASKRQVKVETINYTKIQKASMTLQATTDPVRATRPQQLSPTTANSTTVGDTAAGDTAANTTFADAATTTSAAAIDNENEDPGTTRQCQATLKGKWVYNPNRTFHAPVCCDFYLAGPRCCNESISNYSFSLGAPADSNYKQMAGNACRYMGERENREYNRKPDLWVWEDPALPKYDAHESCKKLGNRTVLMVGDSTMQQSAVTLMNALKPGNCAPQVMYQSADTLILQNFGAYNRGVYWMDAVNSIQPDIVIMSAMHHLVRNDMDDFVALLDKVEADIIRYNRNITNQENKTAFVWKTANPGGCSDEPILPGDPLLAGKARNFSFALDYTRYYHHVTFDRDQYSCGRWATNKSLPNTFILDHRMLYSRSDQHPGKNGFIGDCLHFKAPGPLDVIAPLFQQLLHRIDCQIL